MNDYTRSLIRVLRVDYGPSDEPTETPGDRIEKDYRPHIIGSCGVCKADKQEISIGRGRTPIIHCPTCGVRYRNMDGEWVSDIGRRFVIGTRTNEPRHTTDNTPIPVEPEPEPEDEASIDDMVQDFNARYGDDSDYDD